MYVEELPFFSKQTCKINRSLCLEIISCYILKVQTVLNTVKSSSLLQSSYTFLFQSLSLATSQCFLSLPLIQICTTGFQLPGQAPARAIYVDLSLVSHSLFSKPLADRPRAQPAQKGGNSRNICRAAEEEIYFIIALT